MPECLSLTPIISARLGVVNPSSVSSIKFANFTGVSFVDENSSSQFNDNICTSLLKPSDLIPDIGATDREPISSSRLDNSEQIPIFVLSSSHCNGVSGSDLYNQIELSLPTYMFSTSLYCQGVVQSESTYLFSLFFCLLKGNNFT